MAPSASATDYFVRKTGNNGNAGTSAATAWLTVDYGADQMVAGDTLYVGAGTYTEQVQPAATCSGTAVNPILFVADTDGSHTGDAGTVEIVAASWIALYLDATVHDYLEFYGFKITGGTGNAIQSKDSTGILFDNCEVSGAGGSALRFDAYEVTIRNCSFHDNTGAGIYMLNGTATIENTVIYANLSLAGLFISTSSNITVTRCHIYGNSSHGAQLLSGSSANFTNCLVAGNKISGVFSSSTASDTFDMQNCTVVNNGAYGLLLTLGTNAVTNCIFANNTSDGFSDTSRSTRLNNLLYGNGSGNTAANATEIVADPLFTSATDYHITMFSPAKNAGTDLSGTVDDDIDGRTRPFDGAYDIGCYEEGPVGFWTFDEGTGSTIADTSGLGNDASFNTGTPTWIPGIQGNALEFSGANDAMTGSTFDPPSTGTVTFWFRSDGPPAVRQRLWGLGGDYEMWQDPDGLISCDVNTDGFQGGFITATPLYEAGTWYHIAAVYNSDDDSYTVYVNGEVNKTGISTWAMTQQTANSLSFGTRTGSTQRFSGALDDFRIYDRELNADEVTLLYTGLVGHWKLDETSGTVAADSSGLGNGGTLVGSPIWSTNAVYGGGIEYDYTDGNDYVELPSTIALDDLQESDYTLATWFKPSSVPPETGNHNQSGYGLIKKRNSSIGIHYSHITGYQVNHYADEGAGAAQQAITAAEYPPGRWHHIAMTVNQSAGLVSMYVNGELVGTNTFVAGSPGMDTGSEIWRLGISNPGGANSERPAHGIQDDARIYDRALSAVEIKKLYGLMGHWKLDETSGTVAADSSGVGNDGTYENSPTLDECGPYEKAVAFDGADEYVEATVPEIDTPTAITVACWAKSNTSTWNSDGMLVSKRNQFILYPDTAAPDNLRFRWYVYEEGAAWRATSYDLSNIAGFDIRDWHHYLGTYDPVAGIRKLYVDAVLVASTSSTFPLATDTGPLQIGKDDYWTDTHFFDGTIDDVRVYDRALTEKQIAELYGLVGHWKLDETSGAVATDATAFGNDGVYTNGPVLDLTGKVDRSVKFDGADDYVSILDDSTLQMDDVFSMSAWIRVDSSTNIDRMIINKEGEYEVALSAGNEIKWGITNTDPGWSWHYTGHSIANNAWGHVAVTYDHGTIKTYANGALIDTYLGSGSVGDQYTLLNELRIGGRSNNPSGKYFDGRIDDVRVYSRVLCDDEVQALNDGGADLGIRIIQWVESPNL